MIHNLEIYFTDNIFDEIKKWGAYSSKTSNEIELGGGHEDTYRLYFYVYDKKKNCLYVRDGSPEPYPEHTQIFDFLVETFNSSFKCHDLSYNKTFEKTIFKRAW